MPNKLQTMILNIPAVYFNCVNKLSVTFKKDLLGKDYVCKKHPGLVASFGCEGDKHAPIAYIDGSYRLRDRKNAFITFGIEGIDTKIKWYNSEGRLPCFVSEFGKGEVSYKIENFADEVVFGTSRYEIAYSRLTVKNNSNTEITAPKVSKLLIPLNSGSQTIASGEVAVYDFAVGADRFSGKYPYPSKKEIIGAGGFDEHYANMKKYWEKRLSDLCVLECLPDEKLKNAYEAGYIYTMIVKDGYELHVGENGYDRVFDHDVIGIMVYLLTMGDFRNFKEYSKFIMQNPQYPDARWKFSWPFAYYLFKSGDKEFIESIFEKIKERAHGIEEDIDKKTGIMRATNAIDSLGYWTTDNWSALTGLCCYEYICKRLERYDEAEWARSVYDKLLASSNEYLSKTIATKGIDYIPMAMDKSNDETQRSDPRDANRGSMFLFGRWGWDGYLFCAEQKGVMLELIDKTYEHIFECRKQVSDSIYNFGGYPHGYYCSAYNAGYGAAALRGEKYRDCAIKSYRFMIDHAMSGPFSWWEGVDYPSDVSPWDIPHAAGGGGSCQHIWGQSTAGKALLDSLVCQRVNGELIIGRGVPKEWIYNGSQIKINNYPIENGGKINVDIIMQNDKICVKISGDKPSGRVITELPTNGFEVVSEENYK